MEYKQGNDAQDTLSIIMKEVPVGQANGRRRTLLD